MYRKLYLLFYFVQIFLEFILGQKNDSQALGIYLGMSQEELSCFLNMLFLQSVSDTQNWVCTKTLMLQLQAGR